jgi:hypothetical protein
MIVVSPSSAASADRALAQPIRRGRRSMFSNRRCPLDLGHRYL